MSLINGQQNGAHIERGIAEQREEPGRVDEQFGGKAVRAHAFEYNVIRFQGFLMNT